MDYYNPYMPASYNFGTNAMPNYGTQAFPYRNNVQNMNQMDSQELVTVQTIQQVEQVGLERGQRKIVLVQNEPVIAMRLADNVSNLVTTKYYNLVEFDPNVRANQANTENNYITAEQLEARLLAFAESLKPASKSKKESIKEIEE